jgi:hypothetical protein
MNLLQGEVFEIKDEWGCWSTEKIWTLMRVGLQDKTGGEKCLLALLMVKN